VSMVNTAETRRHQVRPLEYMDSFNQQRLGREIGIIPPPNPVEFETICYRRGTSTLAAVSQ